MTRLLATACLILLGLCAAAQDQDPAAAARDDTDAALRADQQDQRARDAWETERRELRHRYRQGLDRTRWLEERVARERDTVAALELKAAELERRLVESERLTADLVDTLAVLLTRLAGEVDRDLPFLPAERRARLDNLRRELGDPDAPAAEKLRRVLEAYQVEAGYGGTVELDAGLVVVDGAEIHADVLRLGRLALFWRTPDGGRYGMWDPAAAAWVELPHRHRRALAQAMDMAARMRPVQVIGLPVGRIER